MNILVYLSMENTIEYNGLLKTDVEMIDDLMRLSNFYGSNSPVIIILQDGSWVHYEKIKSAIFYMTSKNFVPAKHTGKYLFPQALKYASTTSFN